MSAKRKRAGGGVVLVKLGGSLITDKRRARTPRRGRIGRLARELGEAAERLPGRLIVGHGSGSFGHVAARRHRIQEGIDSPDQLAGVGATQRQAAELHRLVVRALAAAGVRPFSFAPSSAVVSEAGRPVAVGSEPLLRVLDLGLLPVVHGDVVADRAWGASICSTEALFLALAGELAKAGRPVARAFWLGETEGIWDADGATVARITLRTAGRYLEAATGSAGTDVTGGMRHRLETALALARLGTVSQILDGRRPGVLGRALSGGRVGGTVVESG